MRPISMLTPLSDSEQIDTLGGETAHDWDPSSVDLALLAGSHRDMLERLKRDGTLSPADFTQLNRSQRVLDIEVNRRALAPKPDPRSYFEHARSVADPFDFVVAPSHRRNRVGQLVTFSKKAFVEGLKPLHYELVRPQRAFNLQLLHFLGQLLEPRTAEERRILASLSERTLRPLADPTAFDVQGEVGLVGGGVKAFKQRWLDGWRPVFEPILRRQQEWNLLAIDLLALAMAEVPPHADVVHLQIARLKKVSNLPLEDAPAGATRHLYAFWLELFRRQQRFNELAEETVSAMLGYPRPGDTGIASLFPASLLGHEKQRIQQVAAALPSLKNRPLISIVTPTWETPDEVLRACIESVQAQSYDHWELCLVDDGSVRSHVTEIVDEYARKDSRIRVKRMARNGGIARATNEAIAMATGEWVAFLDHDDLIAPHALGEVALRLDTFPDTDLLYSDEDRLDMKGHRHTPFFKPGWSPDLLRSCNYVCHFLVVKRPLLTEIGGIRLGFDGAQDYDLILRVAEKAKRVEHIAEILYHWRATPQSTAHNVANKPDAGKVGRNAVKQHLDRTGIKGTVTSPSPTYYQVEHAVPAGTMASIIVVPRTPMREPWLKQLLSTQWGSFEVVIAGSTAASTDGRVRSIRSDAAAGNVSALANLAAREARGHTLVFLHDDTELRDPGWLEELLGFTARADVGAVGPRLVTPEGLVQQSGLALVDGRALRLFEHMANVGEWTSFGAIEWVRNVTAVSGACLAIRKELFLKTGGFDERWSATESAVDLCVRLTNDGFFNVCTPNATVRHASAHEQGSHLSLEAIDDSGRLHPNFVDRYYNPTLSDVSANGALRASALG